VARAVTVHLTETPAPAPTVVEVRAPARRARWAAHGAAPFVVALIVAVGVAIGAPMRATYGARTTADEPHYLLSALSLWEDHDLDVSDERAAVRYRPFHAVTLPVQAEIQPDGSQIEPHDPLLPVLLGAPVGLGGWLGAKLFMAAMAGVLAGLTMVVAMRRFGVSPVVALSASLVAGLSPPLAIYGTQIYPELPAALVALAGFWWATGRLSSRAVWGAGLAVVALPWLSVKYLPVAAVLAVGLLWRLGRTGRAAWAVGVVAGLGVAAVAFVLGHVWIYGGPTAYASGSHFVAGDFSVVGDRPDYFARSQRVVGLFVDRSFGLAIWQPAALAVVPAVAVLVRRRPRGGLLLVAMVVAGWLTATYLALTMQGWWWPGRQTVVVLPLAVVAVAWWAERLGVVGRRVLLALGLLGVAAYVFLVVGVLGGHHTLIVDFDRTLDPFVRVARAAVPNGLVQDAGTWWGLAAWAGALTVLAAWAMRREPA
jgi:hypothetical protein